MNVQYLQAITKAENQGLLSKNNATQLRKEYLTDGIIDNEVYFGKEEYARILKSFDVLKSVNVI